MNYLVALAVVVISAISIAPVLAPMPRPAPQPGAITVSPPEPPPVLMYPAPAQVDAGGPSQTAPAASTGNAGEAPLQCNVDACAAAYRSFRESDCSYIPSAGERRRCAK